MRQLTLVFISFPILAAEIHAVTPSAGPPVIGPYSPGISVGDYLYISGQGAHRADGTIPDSFEAQVRQTLENIKAIVEAGGLTMDHVIYTQVYLEDIQKFPQMNRVYAQYFPRTPPARATLGVTKLPGTPIEINAVAVRDLANKKAVQVPGYDPGEPASPGILTHDRLFISAMRGRNLRTKAIPQDPAAQVEAALYGVQAVVEAAGLKLSHMVFVKSLPDEADSFQNHESRICQAL